MCVCVCVCMMCVGVCACACGCLCMHVCVCLMCVCLAFRVMLNGMTKLATPLLASSSSLGRQSAPHEFFLTRSTCSSVVVRISGRLIVSLNALLQLDQLVQLVTTTNWLRQCAQREGRAKCTCYKIQPSVLSCSS